MELEVNSEETGLQPLQVNTSDSTSVIGVQDMDVDTILSPSQATDECTSSNDAANLGDEDDTDIYEEDG